MANFMCYWAKFIVVEGQILKESGHNVNCSFKASISAHEQRGADQPVALSRRPETGRERREEVAHRKG